MALFQNQIDKVVDQLETISARERMLLLVGGLAALLLGGFLVSLLISSSLQQQESTNREMELNLEKILRKQGEYFAARKKVKQMEARIRTKGVTRLIPYLDSASKRFQLRIESMRNVSLDVREGKKKRVKELSVRVELLKADLGAVARFFESVERSGRVVKVRQLRMRPNFSDSKKVDVVAVVSSFVMNK